MRAVIRATFIPRWGLFLSPTLGGSTACGVAVLASISAQLTHQITE